MVHELPDAAGDVEQQSRPNLLVKAHNNRTTNNNRPSPVSLSLLTLFLVNRNKLAPRGEERLDQSSGTLPVPE